MSMVLSTYDFLPACVQALAASLAAVEARMSARERELVETEHRLRLMRDDELHVSILVQIVLQILVSVTTALCHPLAGMPRRGACGCAGDFCARTHSAL